MTDTGGGTDDVEGAFGGCVHADRSVRARCPVHPATTDHAGEQPALHRDARRSSRKEAGRKTLHRFTLDPPLLLAVTAHATGCRSGDAGRTTPFDS